MNSPTFAPKRAGLAAGFIALGLIAPLTACGSSGHDHVIYKDRVVYRCPTATPSPTRVPNSITSSTVSPTPSPTKKATPKPTKTSKAPKAKKTKTKELG